MAANTQASIPDARTKICRYDGSGNHATYIAFGSHSGTGIGPDAVGRAAGPAVASDALRRRRCGATQRQVPTGRNPEGRSRKGPEGRGSTHRAGGTIETGAGKERPSRAFDLQPEEDRRN